MAIKTKSELKSVFNGVSSLLYTGNDVDLTSGTIADLAFDYDLPCTVDSLSISQDDPTINHYKVIGLQGDWTSSAEAGDVSVAFTVPTKHSDVLKLAFGTAAYKAITSAVPKSGGGLSGTQWKGDAVRIDMHKVQGTIGLLDETNTNLMIIRGIALYAKPLYENASTEPFAIQFTGTIESDGNQNFAWLTKSAG